MTYEKYDRMAHRLICDRACENQPCECKKIADFFHLYSIITYELFVQTQ